MKKTIQTKIFVLMTLTCAVFLSTPYVYSAQKEDKTVQPENKATQSVKTEKELTVPELIKNIKTNLENLEEIISFIPGLKKETDAAGKITYTYNGKNIEKLDKEELAKLNSRVSTEAVRVRTDRINRQLEMIRRTEQMSKQNRLIMPTPKLPTPIPKTPTVYTSPKTPNVFQPPKIPTVPKTSEQ